MARSRYFVYRGDFSEVYRWDPTRSQGYWLSRDGMRYRNDGPSTLSLEQLMCRHDHWIEILQPSLLLMDEGL